jgi:hypothetical protein
MASRYKAKNWTKVLSTATLSLAGAGFFLMTFAQSAHAQDPAGTIPWELPSISSIPVQNYATDWNIFWILQGIGDMATAVTSMQSLQSTAGGYVADGQVESHAYEISTVAPMVHEAGQHYLPPSQDPTSGAPEPMYNSACAHAQALAQQDTNKRNTAILAKALGGSRPATPSSSTNAAAKFQRDCTIGFKPVDSSGSDAEGAINSKLGCSNSPAPKHVREDRSLSALEHLLQFPAPPDMVGPSNVGVYTPFPTTPPSDEKYYPTYAALGFCQNISPSTPVLPTAGSQATAGMAAIALAKPRQESLDSKVSSVCWNAFAKRLQFSNAMQTKMFQKMHTAQATACLYDFDRHIIGQAAAQDCQTNGRSDLQAEHDAAYRASNPDYQTLYLPTLSPDAAAEVEITADSMAQKFESDRDAELTAMANLMPASSGVGNTSQAAASSVTP